MKIEFGDKRLALIRTDRAHELGLPFAVIKACRKRLEFMEAAPDERSLRNWASLQYKKLEGEKDGTRQIRINDQYRITFTINNDATPPIITILEIGDPH
jgi:proteic killer suppression protein